MKKTKVLHIISNLGSGGAEKLISDMLPIMNENEDLEADLLLLSEEGNVFYKELKTNEINIDIISIKKPQNPLNIFYIKQYIENGGYTIVHAHLFPALYWVSLASRFMNKNKPKFFYTEHSTHNRRRNKSFLRPLERFIYSGFDKIISISDSTQGNLKDWLKLKPGDMEKFTVINNGINLKKFNEAEPYIKSMLNNKFSDDTKLLCMVGRFSEAKDQPTIIKAMKNISNDVHLLLVGEGPLKVVNEKLARDIGVSDRVHFLGFRNDVERILKTSDIVIQSSNWEGFGIAAVEGMASGKPVIGSDIEGLSEVILGHGVLFNKGNSKDLLNKIKCLSGNKKLYDEISKSCLKRSSRFDINKTSKEYHELYFKTLEM